MACRQEGTRTSAQKWFSRAEANFKQIFGENWSDFVTWEGFNEKLQNAEIAECLKRSIIYIKNAQELIENPVSEDSKPTVTKPFIQRNSSQIKIFIVHGHDNVSKLELKNYIQNTLNLPEPIILHEKPNHGHTIIEKFEEYANEVALAFVLLTPDDQLAQRDEAAPKLYRARQNVIFELGYFLGLMGRKMGQVILLYKGTLDIPSDISGLVYINISNGIEAVGEQIRKEISKFIT